MAPRVRGEATYRDLLEVPDHLVAELVEGDLYTSPRPGGPHARFTAALGMDIGPAYDRGRGGPGGWWILDEPELHFGRNVLVPDLAGWRRERMPEIPRDHIFGVPPDWVEVFRRESAAWVLVRVSGGNDKVSAEPFIEVEIDLPSIWGETPDEPPQAP